MSLHTSFEPAKTNFDLGPKTALLLDDCEFDRLRIKRLNSKLATPLLLEEVPDINAMNNCLNANSFDLIMIDYGLGKEDGLSALDMIQRHKLNQNAAKIMISGNPQTSIAVSALKRGCSDYVNKKELTKEVFQRSVYDALKKARPDAVSQHLTVQEVLRQALLDGDLQEVMQQCVRAAIAANGQKQPFAMNMIDDQQALQSLLIGMMDEDEFVFH